MCVYIYVYIYIIYTYHAFRGVCVCVCMGFPSDLNGKESGCNAGDPGPILGWGRAPGEGNGNPLQYSCLENSMDR